MTPMLFITPHAQRERDKVIDHGVHYYIRDVGLSGIIRNLIQKSTV